MPQGGFSRDFHSAAMLKAAAQKERDRKEREKIGNLVIGEISERLDNEVARVEEEMIQKNEESFIILANSIKARDRMLKFLAWALSASLAANALMLGMLS